MAGGCRDKRAHGKQDPSSRGVMANCKDVEKPKPAANRYGAEVEPEEPPKGDTAAASQRAKALPCICTHGLNSVNATRSVSAFGCPSAWHGL